MNYNEDCIGHDGGHGIGIDTATIHQIDMMEDTVPETKEVVPDKTTRKAENPSSYRHIAPSAPSHDNMRGFDPASEDDMDDNGMRRYMEKRLNSESRTMLASTMPSRKGGRVKLNNDEEGWD